MKSFSLLKLIISAICILTVINFTHQNFLQNSEQVQEYDIYVLSINWGSKKIFYSNEIL